METISVIVPVYRVEQFLDQCVQSLIKQTYRNLEIILVDDGSPDSSGKICDMWADRDQRIQVIHQSNHGAGAARNTGLNLASGEFISFVDSDDFLSPFFYECLIGCFSKDVDIVECGYYTTIDGQEQFDGPEALERCMVTSEEAMKYHLSESLFKQIIWNKLYRKEVVDGILFPVGKKIDDEFWTYQAIGNAQNLVHLSSKLYAYRQQPDSVMHQLSEVQRIQSVEAKIMRHQYIIRKYPSLEAESLHTLWFGCMYCYQKLLRDLNCNDKDVVCKQLENTLRQYPFPWQYMQTEAFKNKIWLFMATLSLRITCKIRNRLCIGV